MQIIPLKSRLIQECDDLCQVFLEALKCAGEKVREKDIVVLTSKVVALTEGRIVDLDDIEPSSEAVKLAKETYDRMMTEDQRFTEMVIREADHVLPGNLHLTLKNNILIPAAGIDRSNVPKGKAVLWPKDPQKSADEWREFLLTEISRQEEGDGGGRRVESRAEDRGEGSAEKRAEGSEVIQGEDAVGLDTEKPGETRGDLKDLGVIISDSHCQPLRKGVIGIALAYSGFYGVEDLRGEPDLYGKPLQVTQKAVADNLVSAALIVMGESNESIPFAIIRRAPVKFSDRQIRTRDNFYPPHQCIFEGIYSREFKKMLE